MTQPPPPTLLPDPLSDAERRAEVQCLVSTVLAEAPTVEQALAELLPALVDALSWDYGALWVVEASALRCATLWASDDDKVQAFAAVSRHMQFEAGRGLPGRCWEEGGAVWLSRLHPDPSLPRVPFARAAGLTGGVAFPVMNRRGVVGVVEGFTKRPEHMSDTTLRFVEAIGRQIGQFLYRRTIEEELQRNEERYSAIVTAALDAIVVIDADGHITEFNPAAERLFGHWRDDVLGKDMATLIIPPALRDAHHAGLRRLRESGEARVLERRLELTAMRNGGEEFPVELTISRFPGGQQGAFIGFLRDITEGQRHAREREELLVREREAAEQASAANRLKDEFLAALSHELRTPLNAILGWAQMIAQEALPPEKIAHAVSVIMRNAEVQQQLVDDMLDLSAFIAGRVRLAMEPVPIFDPVQAAIEAVRPAANAKGVVIIAGVSQAVVNGDRTRLQQVFWNLLGNAVKFTPSGGMIEVKDVNSAQMVEIHVRDTGIGIRPDFLPFVFDRFRQGGRERGTGLGLGLAIVRQIVEAHGGTVAAHSEGVGRGSAFTVTLPVASVA